MSRGEEEAPEDAGRDVVVLEGDARDAGVCDGYLSFDGTEGSYVRIPDTTEASLNLRPPFTVEGRFKLEAGQRRVDIMRRCTDTNSGWGLAFISDQLGGYVFGTPSQTVFVDVAGTGWRHVAWTFDGVKSTLFLDGTPLGILNTNAPVLPCSEPLRIGVLPGGTGWLYNAGSIDELRISNVVRYSAAFTPERAPGIDTFTVALWRFDGDLQDATGSHHGSFAGSGVPLYCDE